MSCRVVCRVQTLVKKGVLGAPVKDEATGEFIGLVDIKDFVGYVLLIYGQGRASVSDLNLQQGLRVQSILSTSPPPPPPPLLSYAAAAAAADVIIVGDCGARRPVEGQPVCAGLLRGLDSGRPQGLWRGAAPAGRDPGRPLQCCQDGEPDVPPPVPPPQRTSYTTLASRMNE